MENKDKILGNTQLWTEGRNQEFKRKKESQRNRRRKKPVLKS